MHPLKTNLNPHPWLAPMKHNALHVRNGAYRAEFTSTLALTVTAPLAANSPMDQRKAL